MKFQLFSIFILTLFIQKMNGQVFKPDWNTFTSEKFTLDFQTNITTCYELDTVGELHFQPKSDPSKFIVFFVFERSKIPEMFDFPCINELSISCVRLTDGDYGTYLYEDFQYVLSPWQNCETASDDSFKGIHEEIWNFIIK